MSTDHGSMGEQIGLYKNRIGTLEDELAKVREEKTDQVFQIRKLTTEKERLAEEVQKVKSENVKKLGETQTSGATIARLNAQLNGAKTDLDLMMKSKKELEALVKSQKEEILESEKKAQDYYQQLLSTKENFQILHNEQ